MYKNLYCIYVWNHETYWDNTYVSKWYKYIGYDASDKFVEIEAEVEVVIRGWSTQWPEGLIAPNKELELDK